MSKLSNQMHQVPQEMVSVALSKRWLYLSSHFPESSRCRWAVLVGYFLDHQGYITQFKGVLQCNGDFIVISVKVWSLLLVFKWCMWGKKKKVFTQCQILLFLLKQLYLLLLKQFMLPFAFCHYTGCQPSRHWLASVIIHKKMYFPLVSCKLICLRFVYY